MILLSKINTLDLIIRKYKTNVNRGAFYQNSWSVLSKVSRSQRWKKDCETIEEPRLETWTKKGVDEDTTKEINEIWMGLWIG